MDLRRAPRTVIDPKVRQVGFITPGAAPPPARSHSVPTDACSTSPPAPDLSLLGSSISPVMIPPPRHVSADGLSSLARPAAAVAVHVPASPLRRDTVQIPIGSYNPSETLLGSSPMMSPSSRLDAGSEFFDEVPTSAWLSRRGSGKFASSFPASSGEMMAMKNTGGGGGGNTPKSSLTTASVVKTLPGVSALPMFDSLVFEGDQEYPLIEMEKDGGALIEMQNEGTSKPQKQKTSKAERRALQEAQRAAKAAAKEAGRFGMISFSLLTSSNGIPAEYSLVKGLSNAYPWTHGFSSIGQGPYWYYQVILVSIYLSSNYAKSNKFLKSNVDVGLQYLSGDISGGNARCIAMLLAFKEAIRDYSTPPEKALVRDLTAKISSYVSFLIECRPLSISMGNAIKFLKNRIAKLPHMMSESEAKSSLQSDIDRFINEKIVIADKVIVRHAVTKIRDGDVLLTYGSSSVVEMIFLYAYELGKHFRVVVVDSRPNLEGQALLRRLVAKGLNCTYTHINAISYIMHEVTRVFLGASSVLSNGTVYSRVGTACVAMAAHAFQVPVLICCEAYKFHERVQLDSICSNELGDPDVISKIPGRKDLNHLDNWADNENLQLLNLTYDATPSDYVSMIITDYGMGLAEHRCAFVDVPWGPAYHGLAGPLSCS
ncbi:translation initiation factor eIF-2B subunit delta-like [Cocos nucifera]|uniref:Translation initiation factor eIF2B subunit delta n=1 Tax=Cocos nucifera TaxID=13894 RepID=A0A8K0N4K9_COCNU|nr:translation initiation factor eIF-2B subunit delta-like [Cocos nucifera]